MAITSRRKVAPEPQVEELEVFIYQANGSAEKLSPEDLEHIRRVFESIRKQLDSIGK
jgi:hypothetical protein